MDPQMDQRAAHPEWNESRSPLEPTVPLASVEKSNSDGSESGYLSEI